MYRYCSIVFLCLLITALPHAQENEVAILFIWNDTVMAQSLSGATLLTDDNAIGNRSDAPSDGVNIYEIEKSPVASFVPDNYGFHYGFQSTHGFVYITMAADSPSYQVNLFQNDTVSQLISGEAGIERGYLIPVAWTESGQLMLLERHLLHNLEAVRLWRYDSSGLILLDTMRIPSLKGNAVNLGDGQVFIGFDTVGLQGYVLDVNSRQLNTFLTGFALQDPPASVFETYPVEVIGTIILSDISEWMDDNSDGDIIVSESLSIPFLYWMLPDYARSITCYPDSEWTDSLYAVECPGLQSPREYQGHEGTDIGGRPAGLPVGTQVYAAARGIVADTHSSCDNSDISCGDAYGNYVLLEHTRIINRNTETWFTGYAHLQTVLVEKNAYISELGLPIALSGATGLGGAHLHFEVRSPQLSTATNWIDPNIINADGTGLWIGGAEYPVAAIDAFPPPTLFICQTAAGNNIRSGPGVSHEIVTETTADTDYEVFQIQNVLNDAVPGDWYHLRWQGSDNTGWIWSELMSECNSR